MANIVGAKRPRKFSNDELLSMLVGLADYLGKTPSKRDCDAHLEVTSTTYTHHFGNYNRAVEMAGLAPNKPLPRDFDDERKQVRLSLRFTVLERDKFKCVYCGGAPKDGYVLHVDHVIPRSAGGETVLGNLVTACFVCNEGKSARILNER